MAVRKVIREGQVNSPTPPVSSRGARRKPADDSSLVYEPDEGEIVTRTVWESTRAVLWAIAAVVVPLLLLQIRFVKDMAGFAVEVALIGASFALGYKVQDRMKGYHMWAKLAVWAILGFGLSVILIFASQGMIHRIASAADE